MHNVQVLMELQQIYERHSRGWVPAECLSRTEKKATFSFYSSPAIYNRWVTQRKELNKKKVVTHYCQ